MDIKNRTILVFGGAGLVGMAICRRLVEEKPKKIIVAALPRSEAEQGVAVLKKEFPKMGKNFFVPWWGNIFLRNEFKDTPREQIVNDPEKRLHLIDDILGDLDDAAIRRSSLYHLISKHKPEVIFDCINSATAIAYQNIFSSARTVIQKSKNAEHSTAPFVEATEKLLCSLYIPQLIRHIQILYRSMHLFGTKIYLKIGTSGTGGMGLNIPYTHSEERPSSVLLGKSSVAGAHTMLLFLMGRTPDAPITKEIKPTAAIAWKRIAYGEIKKHGNPIQLFDCPPQAGFRLNRTLPLAIKNFAKPLNKTLKAAFIDTGENGLFSRGEFETITTPGQMEFVTPEEIAEDAIYEIKGGNTGHDIINALDNATLGPTYRAGYLFQNAKNQIMDLEKKYHHDSVAFEMLGPPRLSKLLYEGYLLKLCCKDMHEIVKTSPAVLSKKLGRMIETNGTLRSQIISIGIPILMPDGKTLLRADTMKIPVNKGEKELPVSLKNIDVWTHDGWVDLRVSNMKLWKNRINEIFRMERNIPKNDTSSRFLNTEKYWSNFKEIDPGKLAGWIFSYEEKGMRMKA
jgi:hypothetical protein